MVSPKTSFQPPFFMTQKCGAWVLRDMEHGIMKTVFLHTLLKPALELEERMDKLHLNKLHLALPALLKQL